MITWSKYPDTKPDRKGIYVVWVNGVYDRNQWLGNKWLVLDKFITHFTEINPPQPDIVQPSTEGC